MDLDPSQGDQACPAHISLLYKGVLRFTLGSYSVFLLDSWTWCVIQIVIIQTLSSILTKCSLNIFTEYSGVVWKFPGINVKFPDQHMVDKWLEKKGFQEWKQKSGFAGFWSFLCFVKMQISLPGTQNLAHLAHGFTVTRRKTASSHLSL